MSQVCAVDEASSFSGGPSAVDARERLGLAPGQVRAVHARLFGAALNQCAGDEFVDEDEVGHLAQLADAFGQLGWAPGR